MPCHLVYSIPAWDPRCPHGMELLRQRYESHVLPSPENALPSPDRGFRRRADWSGQAHPSPFHSESGIPVGNSESFPVASDCCRGSRSYDFPRTVSTDSGGDSLSRCRKSFTPFSELKVQYQGYDEIKSFHCCCWSHRTSRWRDVETSCGTWNRHVECARIRVGAIGRQDRGVR